MEHRRIWNLREMLGKLFSARCMHIKLFGYCRFGKGMRDFFFCILILSFGSVVEIEERRTNELSSASPFSESLFPGFFCSFADNLKCNRLTQNKPSPGLGFSLASLTHVCFIFLPFSEEEIFLFSFFPWFVASVKGCIMQEPPPTSLVWKVAHSLLHARGDMSQESFLSSFFWLMIQPYFADRLLFWGYLGCYPRYEAGKIKTRLCTKNWGTLS